MSFSYSQVDKLIGVREPWFMCLDSEQKFSSKPNGVLFGIREIFSNGTEFSLSPWDIRNKGLSPWARPIQWLEFKWGSKSRGCLMEPQVHPYKKGAQ